MFRILMVVVTGTFAFMTACTSLKSPSSNDSSDFQYEVLNPWAEVDQMPLRGISPRVDTLAGKKIGLFANYKRAARPIQTVVARKLKERFPNCQTVLFDSHDPNVTETETKNRDRFEAWAKEVDAVIAAVGD